jgi:hypothetical protein
MMMAKSGMPANPYHYWTRSGTCVVLGFADKG